MFDSSRPSQARVRLCTLYRATDHEGRVYLRGRLGDAKLIVTPVDPAQPAGPQAVYLTRRDPEGPRRVDTNAEPSEAA